MAAIKKLNKEDFIEMKSFKKPPIPIKMTMEAVCILMGLKGIQKRVFMSATYICNFHLRIKRKREGINRLLGRF